MSKVLIVEDELIVATSYRVFLQRSGHEVVATAASSRKAKEAYKKLKPELVLLDLRLKNNDSGLEVAQYIRKSSQTPIIFTTGNPRAITLKEIQEIPNSEILNKPIDNNVLLHTMEKIIK